MHTKHTIIEGRYISADSAQPVSFKAVGFKSESIKHFVIGQLADFKKHIVESETVPTLMHLPYANALIQDAKAAGNAKEKMLHDIELLEKILKSA